MTEMQIVTNNEVVRLVPSLDGALYKIGRGGRMTALPISVDTLLATTSKITDDLTFSGKLSYG